MRLSVAFVVDVVDDRTRTKHFQLVAKDHFGLLPPFARYQQQISFGVMQHQKPLRVIIAIHGLN